MQSATYAIYILGVILITVLVARTLSRNGGVFLVDGFGGDEALARSINHLLVVGFYLVNLGFALLQLESRNPIDELDQALVFLSGKIGFVLLFLGVVHFFNLFVIGRFKASQENRLNRARLVEHELAGPRTVA